MGLVPELICSAPSLPTAELRVAWHQLNASGHIVSAQSALISESGTRLVVDTPTPEGGSLLATFVSTGEEAVSATCVLEELEPEKSGSGCIHVSRTSPFNLGIGLGYARSMPCCETAAMELAKPPQGSSRVPCSIH